MSSKRAAIIEAVLNYVDSGDWEYVGEFMVFGKIAFDEYVDGEVATDNPIVESIMELIRNLKLNQGQRELLPRTSMRQPPPDTTAEEIEKLILSLPGNMREDILLRLSADPEPRSVKNHDPDDAIDAALARELVKDLHRSADRVRSLERFECNPSSNQTAAYFQEAHRCDMYGLPIAAVILCRAIVEDALKKAIDPTDASWKRLLDKRSYVPELLSEAVNSGHLDKSREIYANEIRKAGNAAVHELPEFRKKYQSRSTELVDQMRLILEDLDNGSSLERTR